VDGYKSRRKTSTVGKTVVKREEDTRMGKINRRRKIPRRKQVSAKSVGGLLQTDAQSNCADWGPEIAGKRINKLENKFNEKRPNAWVNMEEGVREGFVVERLANKTKKKVRTSRRIHAKRTANALAAKKKMNPAPKKKKENKRAIAGGRPENQKVTSERIQTTQRYTEKEMDNGDVWKRIGSGKILIGFQMMEKFGGSGHGKSKSKRRIKGAAAKKKRTHARSEEGMETPTMRRITKKIRIGRSIRETEELF
jgi:hypothetical protein